VIPDMRSRGHEADLNVTDSSGSAFALNLLN
jgi:hypothetical protein